MPSRRNALSGAAAILYTLASPAWAQPCSGAPLKLVVPYPPGGLTDVVSRMVGTRLQPVLGQTNQQPAAWLPSVPPIGQTHKGVHP